MDYQTYRPMTIPSKHENRSKETLLQNTIIIMLNNQEQTNLPKKNTQNLNHVFSLYWNLPKHRPIH